MGTASCNWVRPIGDHLVGVHVRRRAGAALDHIHHELTVQVAGHDFITGLANRFADRRIEVTQFQIGFCGRFFYHRQGFDEVGEVRQGNARDPIVFYRPQGLNTEVNVGRNTALSQQIVFQAHFPARRSRHGSPVVAETGVFQSVCHDSRNLGEDFARDLRMASQVVPQVSDE
jgi:hypothetical protein